MKLGHRHAQKADEARTRGEDPLQAKERNRGRKPPGRRLQIPASRTWENRFLLFKPLVPAIWLGSQRWLIQGSKAGTHEANQLMEKPSSNKSSVLMGTRWELYLKAGWHLVLRPFSKPLTSQLRKLGSLLLPQTSQHFLTRPVFLLRSQARRVRVRHPQLQGSPGWKAPPISPFPLLPALCANPSISPQPSSRIMPSLGTPGAREPSLQSHLGMQKLSSLSEMENVICF